MTVLTAFTTFVEKNYIMFAVQKDEAGVVSQFYWFKLAHHVFPTFNDMQTLKLQKHLINTFYNRMGPWEDLKAVTDKICVVLGIWKLFGTL